MLLAVALLAFIIKSKLLSRGWRWLTRRSSKDRVLIGIITIAGIIFMAARTPYPINFAMPPTMHSHAPGGMPPSIPIASALKFLWQSGQFERVTDIGADPTAVPSPITRSEPALVKFELTAKEVIGQVADGIYFNYWTYNGQTPGPMLRVKLGDTVELTLHNDPTSLHPHNIDLHAVTGPGGGASVTTVEPGESKTVRWKALNPGLYVYHCANPNVSTHNSHGQYGLILVEPTAGLPAVDKEFYIMQGELYTMGDLGEKGLQLFDPQAMLDGQPNYVTFNGKVETTSRMQVRTGDRVRIYVGNGGVNLISSFHVIGEIFHTVYPEAAMGKGSMIEKNVQTTAILPGGATIVEFTADVPGKYLLVDHALARMNKGAWAVLEVTGDPRPDIFQEIK